MGLRLMKSIKRAAEAGSYHLQIIGEIRCYSKTPVGVEESSVTENHVGHDEQLKKGVDYVGPVCPRSNLRQVWYSTRFSSRSFVHQEVPKKKLQHPYSLQEFRSDPIQPPQPLSELQARLELEDLEWCFFRSRVDKFNQSFWEAQSTRFEEYEAEVKLKVSQSKQDLSNLAQNNLLQDQLDCSLDEFFRSWLIQEKEAFIKYNWVWWSFQPALMKGGWKAQMRNLKWKLACWKYNLSFQNWTK